MTNFMKPESKHFIQNTKHNITDQHLSIQLLLNLNPHRLSSPNNRLGNRLQRHILTIRIRLFDLSNLINMFQC
ncbi:hypothetical protein HanRHA438_Chr16g0788131 [Helianthus annuus]|nr:hypothetical protein HanRHA438_Chr16g0788131 [Helianthus annuus]